MREVGKKRRREGKKDRRKEGGKEGRKEGRGGKKKIKMFLV